MSFSGGRPRFGGIGAALLLFFGAALLPCAAAPRGDVVVAADGSGDFTSLQDAISKAPMPVDPQGRRWVIFVKAGTYKERIYVQRERGRTSVLLGRPWTAARAVGTSVLGPRSDIVTV